MKNDEKHTWKISSGKNYQNEEYMTGWEILESIFLFAMILGTVWLFLLINY